MISLAGVITDYEDEMICDLAETYGIYDYTKYEPLYIATLVSGLRTNSRVVMKMQGVTATNEEIMSAMTVDGINTLVWMHTEDAETGRNRPKSVRDILLGTEEKKPIASFDTLEDFEKRRQEIING